MKLKKIILTILIFTFYEGYSIGNDSLNVKKNNIQIEIGGHGLLYSLNYERFLFITPKYSLSTQVGCSYYPNSTFRTSWFPIMINQNIIFGKHRAEFSIGRVYNYEKQQFFNDSNVEWTLTNLTAFRLGYRYKKNGSKLLYRVGFTPFIEHKGFKSIHFYPSFGGSVGYSF